ncbi:MAG TPA: C-GCAxxG-C-C family protein [Acidobacteriota bacterium]|nr:C-GCAxxG-C-C family protein [Acidobacteriota bacterium]HQF88080.1 C-GCAxxG-C-C family protein [Acidobacteriota bacterium]HQG92110.1 C-GCAxxG-C-C family protein [Acidobacteriota bacterium]HQK86199.1 C-GCAxxG-C-C family protein [Acidobacteriota bacterium]
MHRVKLAAALSEEGLNCAQAVIGAYGPELGLSRDLAMGVAAVFGGGLGRTAGVCGAVSGAVMALGLRHGARAGADTDTKERAYALTKEFLARFAARHGTVLCRELLGVDVGTAEGLTRARTEGKFKTLCPNFVRTAAELLEEML